MSDVTRFHNLSNEALADAIGHADAVLKGAEAECDLLKGEFKARGLGEVAGVQFTVTASGEFSTRLDTKRVKQFLGAECARFEVTTPRCVIRIKAVQRPVAVAEAA
jgi:hypothetical protein